MNNFEPEITSNFKNIDRRINRFHITNPEQGELLIRVKASKKFAPLESFLFFGGMGVFFLYLFNRYHSESGFSGGAIVCLFFGVFSSIVGSVFLVNGYSKIQSFHFKPDEVLITKF